LYGRSAGSPKIDRPEAQPTRGNARLNGVNAKLFHPADHQVALELLLRLLAAALVTIAILGLLPAIAEAAA
jgi:hypothetical protein